MTRARILADYVAGGTTATEFDHLDGVTSNVQTQLDAKLPLAGGTMTGDLVPATPLSHRNMIINGAMTVAQRATTKANEGGQGYLTVDRFSDKRNGMAATMNFYQADDAPTGFKKSWKITNNGDEASLGNSDHFYLRYKIEGQDLQHLEYGTSSAKTITLSFWVRSTVTGTGCIVFFMDGDKQYSTSYTINTTNTWEQKIITITGNTATAVTNTNGMGMEINWFLCAGSDYTSGSLSNAWENSTLANRAVGQANFVGGATGRHFAITGVQLELGSSATPFEHRSFADELARCQRYYCEPLPQGSTFSAMQNSTTHIIATIPAGVPMRAAPSLTTSGTWYFSKTNGFSSTSNQIAVGWDYMANNIQAGGNAGGDFSGGQDMHAASVYIGTSTWKFDAEL